MSREDENFDDDQISDEEQAIIDDGLEYDINRAIRYKIFLQDGGSAIELLKISIDFIEKKQAIPPEISPTLLKYLYKKLSEEEKRNKKREHIFLNKKRIRHIATQIKCLVALGRMKKTEALRLFYEKEKKRDDSNGGLSFDTFRKRVQRQIKKDK